MKERVEKVRRVESGASTKKPPTLHRWLFSFLFFQFRRALCRLVIREAATEKTL
jgi:hypothetical protein